jgi:membrane-bound serine protease (ClpP class)
VLLVIAIILAILYVPWPWGLVLVLGIAVFEVAETLFWVRLSRRWRIRAGAETLIGARGEVVSGCDPVGQIRVGGELWQARCETAVEPGTAVHVVARDGLTLHVEPE